MTKKSDKPKSEKTPVDHEALAKAQRSSHQSRLALKKLVRYFYDLQRLRLQTAGRLYKRPDGSKIDLHELDLALLETRVKELESVERLALKDIENHLGTIPFYRNVLSDKNRFRGIGPTMAGVILAEFDIAREDTASKMWSFSGLRPLPCLRCKFCHEVVFVKTTTREFVEIVNGKTRQSKATDFHTVEVNDVLDSTAKAHPKARSHRNFPADDGAEVKKSRSCKFVGELLRPEDVYVSGHSQKPRTGEKLPYNAFLRTKLVGVLGPVLIKLNSPWRKLYDEYKLRMQSKNWGKSDGHRHNAANRYMIKMLLLEIWKEWRAAEGLPVRPSYQEEKLGHTHSGKSQVAHDTQSHHADFEDETDPEIQAEIERASAD